MATARHRGPVAQIAAMTETDVATYTRDRPGVSAFELADGAVYHSYSSYARGWTASGACTNGSTAPPRAATSKASGGATTTAMARSDCDAASHPHLERGGGNAALNTAEWLSLSAAADGSAAKPNCKPATLAVADWLSLAAAPTFAIMALLTATTGSADMICMTAPDAFPIGGMVPMYLLMSGFHWRHGCGSPPAGGA